MDDNREKQMKESHTTESGDKQPGTGGPLHVVIMPTSLTVAQQQKSLLDNRVSEPMMTYSSQSTAAHTTQTRAKPVRLVLMPSPSTADQQLPCTSIINQSERKVLLLPHSVKQCKKASLSSDLTDQNAKNVHTLNVMKDCKLTSCKAAGAGTHDDASDSHSVLRATSLKDEGQNSHMTGGENGSDKTQLSHSNGGQSGGASTYLSGRSYSPEAQQCENINSSEDSRVKEEYTSERIDSRPGLVPPHLIVMTASPKEIDYRIKAFLARKRAELDIQNVEEYCLHIGMNPNVCARVDATVHQHRKRKKRKFEFTPQPEEKAEDTQFVSKDASQEQLPLSVAHPILEERVSNVEAHLRLGKPVPKDIYSRLKRIEDRILRLEGISPEYIYDAAVDLHPPRTLPKIKRKCTIDELNSKIAELQKKLEKKPDSTSQKEIVK